MSTENIYQGEQILSEKIAPVGEARKGLVYTITPGNRAVTVGINPVNGVAGFLEPGDRVDVVATVKVSGSGRNTAISTTIIQNARVLAAGKNLFPVNPTVPDEEMKTVTLEVTPQKAQLLSLAEKEGTINLLLRSPADGNYNNIPVSMPENWLRSRGEGGS